MKREAPEPLILEALQHPIDDPVRALATDFLSGDRSSAIGTRAFHIGEDYAAIYEAGTPLTPSQNLSLKVSDVVFWFSGMVGLRASQRDSLRELRAALASFRS